MCHTLHSHSAVDSDGFTHRGLDVEGSNILPSLLQEGNQEVDRHVDVLSELLLRKSESSDGGTHAKDLLQLELDGGLQFLNLLSGGFVLSQSSGEFTDLRQSVTEQLGDLLHEGFGSNKHVIRLGPLLDELLVLVELLQTINIDAADLALLGLLAMGSGTDQTNSSVGGGDIGESDGAVESLILFGIVVSNTDLELNSLGEFSLLLVLLLDHSGDSLSQEISGDLGCHFFFLFFVV
mmetsp:Transcript_74119/g.103035  ORF Transcript_74119/g.103035 Transcript_74119/m.103035 type:complete len:236 (+) Transcript_74119:341-1048(+)